MNGLKVSFAFYRLQRGSFGPQNIHHADESADSQGTEQLRKQLISGVKKKQKQKKSGRNGCDGSGFHAEAPTHIRQTGANVKDRRALITIKLQKQDRSARLSRVE